MPLLDTPVLVATAEPPYVTARSGGPAIRRFTFDRLLSIGGLMMVAVLCAAGGLLLWAKSYTHNEVSAQLLEQQIYFPSANNPAIAASQFAPMKQYAGEQLTTGPQANVCGTQSSSFARAA